MKQLTEEQLSKSKLKQYYRNFWTSWKWVPGRSPQLWCDLMQRSTMVQKMVKRKLKEALVKLELERKVLPKQKEELTKMLESPDKESNYLAISIIAALAPKRFQRKTKNK